MALRNVRITGDEILRKKSKKVKNITPRTEELIEDMLETMYEEEGVGLAAVQVGVLKRIVVIDIGDGPIILINPEITEKSEEELLSVEGCLSVPKESGYTYRPKKVKIKATDKSGEEIEVEGEDFLAKAICHELDHLDGILYTDITVTPSEEEIEEYEERMKSQHPELYAEASEEEEEE